MARLSAKQQTFIKNLKSQGFTQKQINDAISSFERENNISDKRNILTRTFDYIDNGPGEAISKVLSGKTGDVLEKATKALPYAMAATVGGIAGGPAALQGAKSLYNAYNTVSPVAQSAGPISQTLQPLEAQNINQEQLPQPDQSQEQQSILNFFKNLSPDQKAKLLPDLLKIGGSIAAVPFAAHYRGESIPQTLFGKPERTERTNQYSPEEQSRIDAIRKYSQEQYLNALQNFPRNSQQNQSGQSLYQRGMSYMPSLESIQGNRNLMAMLGGLGGGALGSLGGQMGSLLGTGLGGYLGGYWNDFGKQQ